MIPPEILQRDYGCGDPSRYVRSGDRVLDLGSGGGKICYIASQIVGPAGNVVGVDEGRSLQVVGDTSPAWGGPSRHWHTWTLEDSGSGTKLRFESAIWGRVSDATRASLEEGWAFLFEQGLKRWCETGTLEGAPDAPSCSAS